MPTVRTNHGIETTETEIAVTTETEIAVTTGTEVAGTSLQAEAMTGTSVGVTIDVKRRHNGLPRSLVHGAPDPPAK